MTLILIDCENFSHNCVEEIFADYQVGPDVCAHGFCDFSISTSWTKELFLKFNITPHQVFHANHYKNAADMALARFAMEHIFTGDFNELVIASSDSDFTDLMSFAKARGLRVICYASNALINPNLKLACSELKICKKAKSSKTNRSAKSPESADTAIQPNRIAKSPAQTASKAEQNAEQIKALLIAKFNACARVSEFISLLKKRELISKKKTTQSLKADLLKAGFYIENDFISTDKSAAKSAQKPAAQQAKTSHKTAPRRDYLKLFYDEIFAHKCKLQEFANCLKSTGCALPKQDVHSWLRKKGFAVLADENFYYIYPASALSSGQISEDFKHTLRAKFAEHKERAIASNKGAIAEFAALCEQEINLKTRLGLWGKIKRLCAGTKLRARILKTLEAFYELHDGSSCSLPQLQNALASEQIIIDQDWLNDCALELEGAQVYELRAPKLFSFCEQEFLATSCLCELAPNQIEQINKLDFSQPIEPEIAVENAPASEPESAPAPEPASAPEPAASQNRRTEKPSKRSTQSLEMLQNFAPAARLLFLYQLCELDNCAASFCEYLNSLNLKQLAPITPADLKLLNLAASEDGRIAASAIEFAKSLQFKLQTSAPNLQELVLNAYASTLNEHKGSIEGVIAALQNRALLPGFYSREAGLEFCKLFGLINDGEKIFPIHSSAQDLAPEHQSATAALKNYSLALAANAQIDELQLAALRVCLLCDAASVKADFLLQNCILKRHSAPRVGEEFALAKALLELIGLSSQQRRSKALCAKRLGASALKALLAKKLAASQQLCGEEALFLCYEYQAHGALNAEVAKEYFAHFYAANAELAASRRAALCELFDAAANEHGGHFINFINLSLAQEILGAKTSARIKKLHLLALDFAISSEQSALIAKPGEQPIELAPSQQMLDELAASALAAAAGLFSEPAKQAAAKNAPAKTSEKPQRKIAPKPDASAIASTIARVQQIKHELGQVQPKELIIRLRELKIRPRDAGCANWASAFKKYAIFED